MSADTQELAERKRPKLDLTSPQKAAAVVLAIGAERAAEILTYLSESEVEQLATEVASLRALPVEELEAVVAELHEEAMGQHYMMEGGIEYARDMLVKWKGSRGEEILDRLVHAGQNTPFDFVAEVEPEQLVQFVQGEHPQTVALLLSYLPSSYSSRVLAGLPPDVRGEVAIRIASMDKISPEVIRRVEASIRARIGSVGAAELTHRGGIKELASILNMSDRTTERAIIATLSEHDAEMAEDVRSLMFLFEDIVTLMDRDIQEVLRTLEPRTLALAMKGVRGEVREAVLRNMSDRARELLTDEIAVLGAVRLREVETAQSEVVASIRKLDEEGKITMRRDADGGLVE
jgi:flagellar motor switch protein FliG